MKRKIIGVLLGITAATAACGSGAMAMTCGFDVDGKTIYITEYQNPETAVGSTYENGDEISEYGISSSDYLSEEEKQRLSDWHKQEMREAVAYLEKYGVSYDAEKDLLLYQGKTVRWLIDEQIEGTMRAIQMPEGEIDLYTERGQDYTLTGVRVASQEEYDRRTKEDEEERAVREKIELEVEAGTGVEIEAESRGAASYTEEAADAEAGSIIHTFISEDIGVACEDTSAISRDISVQEQNAEEVAEGTCVYGNSDNSYEMNKKIREYEQHGILHDKNGGWTWNGKQVYLLMDEDGSFYQNGSKEAKDNKVYLIVKRGEDESIAEVKQVTVEEAMAERIARDN